MKKFSENLNLYFEMRLRDCDVYFCYCTLLNKYFVGWRALMPPQVIKHYNFEIIL